MVLIFLFSRNTKLRWMGQWIEFLFPVCCISFSSCITICVHMDMSLSMCDGGLLKPFKGIYTLQCVGGSC